MQKNLFDEPLSFEDSIFDLDDNDCNINTNNVQGNIFALSRGYEGSTFDPNSKNFNKECNSNNNNSNVNDRWKHSSGLSSTTSTIINRFNSRVGLFGGHIKPPAANLYSKQGQKINVQGPAQKSAKTTCSNMSKSKSKSQSKGQAKTKAKGKVKTKTKAKTKAKPKAKEKGKSKSKSKSKSNTKNKNKAAQSTSTQQSQQQMTSNRATSTTKIRRKKRKTVPMDDLQIPVRSAYNNPLSPPDGKRQRLNCKRSNQS